MTESYRILYTVFSLVFMVTGKSVFWTGKAALLKIVFYPGVEVLSGHPECCF